MELPRNVAARLREFIAPFANMNDADAIFVNHPDGMDPDELRKEAMELLETLTPSDAE